MSIEPGRWGVIYNPKAGTRKAHKRWKEIKEYIDSRNVSYDYVQSEGFGSVERLARILANNGYRIIVVVGGDGALNDAINGIMHSNVENKGDIAIGIIPNGIGNDFAKYWNLELEYKEAVDWIINNRRRKIDIGYCRYYDGEKHQQRYFLNAVNIGLGARIVKITDQTKRFFWGVKVLSYGTAFFLTFFERKLYRMHLQINGENIRGRMMTVCVGNASGYGQTPSAVPYNGWLDVSIVHRPQFFQIFTGAVMLIRRRILNHKVVTPFRTKKVKVIYARNAAIDLDGRLLPKQFPIEIGIKQEATTLIIPD
jgi:Sphingosine kinase and enzymes related to eukaryotic diacylglycerol kinase